MSIGVWETSGRVQAFTGMQSNEHVTCTLITLQAVLIDHLFVAFLFHFLLEEKKKVMIVSLVTKVLMELLVVMKVHYDRIINRLLWSLS